MVGEAEPDAKENGRAERFPATGMPDRDWWSALWPDPEGVLRKLGLSSGMTVVDLCCGDGYFTAPLSRIVGPGTAYAVDMDPGVLDRAREEVARHGVPENCVFVLADARELAEYIGAPADIVVLANTFHGVPDQTTLSRRVREVLKPDGGFVIVNWHRVPKEQTPVLGEPRGPDTGMRMSPDMVETVVEPAGFYRERVVELPPHHYGMVFRARASV